MGHTCPECGKPVHRTHGRGRPRLFDSAECRKAAECRRRQRYYKLGAAVDRALKGEL